AVLDAFHAVTDDRPTCFIAYTIKGYGLPFAGHKDNHAGLMNLDQMAEFRAAMAVPDGDEWAKFAGLDVDPQTLQGYLHEVSAAREGGRRHAPPPIPVPAEIPAPRGKSLSTQEAFGRILGSLAGTGGDLADRIVTTSPDVTVSTNLGAWVNRRGIFDRAERADTFREEKVVSAQRWAMSPQGQHIEPAFADELAVLMRWALSEIQAEDGQSVYLRLSTRPIEQPDRAIGPDLAAAIVDGAYWLREPEPGADLAIAYSGAVAPEALAAFDAISEDVPGAGLLAVTSPERLHRDWQE